MRIYTFGTKYRNWGYIQKQTKLSPEENQFLAKMCVTHLCELNIAQNQIQRTKKAGVDCNRKHNNISNDVDSSIP